MDDFELVGAGLTVFEHDEPVQGPVVWLDSPSAVLDFVSGGDVADSIVLARGGTTTFLTPALSAGVKGVMTLQGAPESHLGILSREYGIPCLMSVAFTEGVTSSRGETIPPDGALVRMIVSGSPEGQVFIERGARTYGTSGGEGAAAPDPEAAAQAEQLRALMASYRGEIADGPAGDRQLRARLRTGVLDGVLTGERANLHRDLDPAEVGDFLAYSGWNLWDLIKARQTEGESGLIPRQEYETVGFVQQWGSYARWIDLITDKIGADGVIELGGLPRREIGTKANHVHIWGAGACPLIGKAIAGQLGLTSDLDDHRNANTIISFMRRLQYGLWGEGPGFVSGRGYRVPALARSWLDRFRDEETRLADPDQLAAFRKFNATTELTGFLLHYDCRAGLCDTGPYPLPDGGFVIVRDHFLYEPAYEWAAELSDLPYCVTEAMFFRPDTPVTIAINDIATTFAQPRNYLKYLSGAVVYARDRWDTPVSEVRRLDEAEMARIVDRCNESMLSLYTSIGELSWDERIRNGVKVYCREMLLPYARAAGVWDSMISQDYDALTDLTEQAYPVLAGGQAQQVLGAVFLMGQGLVPDTGLGAAPEVGPDALPALHALALRGNLAELPGDPDPLLDAGLVAHTPAGYLLTEAGHRRHGELLAAERGGVDQERLGQAYERFLAVNGPLKSLSARAGTVDEDGRFALLGEVEVLIERVGPALRRTAELLPRFGGYRSRLAEALRRAEDGEWAYLTSPTVDSVHTVWMEAHEDYLRTLDRSREAEGSY
ncbi:MAG: PEP-utilizing enzyme mobile domain [Pseudonocardia sp.]|nr:PEP-utilizing enzyme mobile domain [Pseudonocardia sp.]